MVFSKLRYSDEIFEIYRQHSLDRFNQDSTKEHFVESFFTNAVPAMQSEYYIDNKLAGVGFVDISDEALSSVYFFYKTEYNLHSLGTFSVIREIELAVSMKLKYYYLGYYIEKCPRMRYKNRFKPYDLYNWDTGEWTNEENKQ